MSEEQLGEEREPTEQEVLAIMSDPEFLAQHGYRLTPKGIMALTLMQMGLDKEKADTVSEVMSDQIFKAGWTYLPPESTEVEVPDGV